MDRRTFVKGTAAVAGAVAFPRVTFGQAAPVKVGVVGAKTGALAGGAAVTHFPPFRLWAKQVNDAGGLKLKGGQRKIELIEYDDRTQPGEAIKAVERLATVDKADFVMALYGTGFNLAAAPIFDKYKYPHMPVAAITDKQTELTKQYPNLFFCNGTVTDYATTAAELLVKLKNEGKINNRLAVAHIADTFGIEMANIGRGIFEKAGFNIVYSTSYPFTSPDLAPIVKGAKAANPDAFVAWSYPPDTMTLAEQAKIEGLTPKVYFTGVGTAFPGFKAKYGASAEAVMGLGGIQDGPQIRKLFQDLKDATSVAGDFNATQYYWASLQILQQAIEGVGSVDLPAVTQHFRTTNVYKTVVGDVNIKNQKISSVWTVGQWQGDTFQGVNGVNVQGAKPVQLKTGWA